MLNNKRIFVSGGAGVIGIEVVNQLIEQGAEVFVGDLKPRPESFSRRICYRQGDLNMLSPQELKAFSPEIFIHLAATFERSLESYSFWEENFWNNVRLSNYLMSISKDLSSLQRVVFASSYLIYDPSLYQFRQKQERAVSLKETDPIRPRNLTGMAKLSHEAELQFLESFKETPISTVSARIFRGYGKGSRDVISRWIRLLLSGKTIQVYRPEGLFDYIYAKDSAEGLLRLAENRDVRGVVNLGTGNARRVNEIVDILKQHFPNMKYIEEESDIPFEASQADMSKFYQSVNWSPHYSLENAIPEMIAYEKTKLLQSSYKTPNLYIGNILITSASKKVPLVQSVKKAAFHLGTLKDSVSIIAGDSSNVALTQYVADNFWLMPPTVSGEIANILAGCKERRVRVILPTRDGELLFWAENRERFARENIYVSVSSPESIRTCLDKLLFARFCSDQGFPVIPTVERLEELKTFDVDTFVVKERYGAGSQNIGLNLNQEEVAAFSMKLEYPIYQPFIEGVEISADIWASRESKVKGVVLRYRDIVINGESQVTTTFQDKKLEILMQDIVERLRLRGHIVLQALIDRLDNVWLIECNPRFGGASTAAIAVGLDSFYWTLLEAWGTDMSTIAFQRKTKEVRQVRVAQDCYFDINADSISSLDSSNAQ